MALATSCGDLGLEGLKNENDMDRFGSLSRLMVELKEIRSLEIAFGFLTRKDVVDRIIMQRERVALFCGGGLLGRNKATL